MLLCLITCSLLYYILEFRGDMNWQTNTKIAKKYAGKVHLSLIPYHSNCVDGANLNCNFKCISKVKSCGANCLPCTKAVEKSVLDS